MNKLYFLSTILIEYDYKYWNKNVLIGAD